MVAVQGTALRDTEGLILMHEVCIVGAGPAGLSAALILGRCRRDVMVFDSGKPRNAASRGLHGFITRDGAHPMQLRELARAELARYATVRINDREVLAVKRRAIGDRAGFEIQVEGGTSVQSRMLLLATGRDDEVPEKRGFRELYGRGVYHCPICDGWEHRDLTLVTYGRGEAAYDVALALLTWSRDVTLCTDGPTGLTEEQLARLAANDIRVREEEVVELQAGSDGSLAGIRFVTEAPLACAALFFVSDCPQKSILPQALGCRLDESGGVRCKEHAATDVPGLFVAGNVRCGLHLAVTAAAEGAEAAVAINEALSGSRQRRID